MIRKYLLKSSINTARMTRLIAKFIDISMALLASIFFYPFGLIVGIGYLAIADSLPGGQSVGKKMLGFQVISLDDGEPCSLKQSVIRNLPIVIPFCFAVIPLWGWIFCAIFSVPLTLMETYLLFKLDSAHRLGDVMADTTVIANDGNRLDLRKSKSSWFDSKTMAYGEPT